MTTHLEMKLHGQCEGIWSYQTAVDTWPHHQQQELALGYFFGISSDCQATLGLCCVCRPTLDHCWCCCLGSTRHCAILPFCTWSKIHAFSFQMAALTWDHFLRTQSCKPWVPPSTYLLKANHCGSLHCSIELLFSSDNHSPSEGHAAHCTLLRDAACIQAGQHQKEMWTVAQSWALTTGKLFSSTLGTVFVPPAWQSVHRVPQAKSQSSSATKHKSLALLSTSRL